AVGAEPAEGDLPTRLAGNQLGGGDVDRAAWAEAQHPVEAAGSDVTGGDRDRANDAKPVDLPVEDLERGQRPARLGRLDPQDLEHLAVLSDADRPLVEGGAGSALGGELLAGPEVVDVAELDVG